jgi:hypothetical protein
MLHWPLAIIVFLARSFDLSYVVRVSCCARIPAPPSGAALIATQVVLPLPADPVHACRRIAASIRL